MNCLYRTLFFKIFAGIVQTFTKSSNQLQYPRFIDVCRQHFAPHHRRRTFSQQDVPSGEETHENRRARNPEFVNLCIFPVHLTFA